SALLAGPRLGAAHRTRRLFPAPRSTVGAAFGRRRAPARLRWFRGARGRGLLRRCGRLLGRGRRILRSPVALARGLRSGTGTPLRRRGLSLRGPWACLGGTRRTRHTLRRRTPLRRTALTRPGHLRGSSFGTRLRLLPIVTG